MATATQSQKAIVSAAILRALRAAIAFGLPYFISYLAKNPDVRWSGLGVIIMGIAKYLRDSYPDKFEWLPV